MGRFFFVALVGVVTRRTAHTFDHLLTDYQRLVIIERTRVGLFVVDAQLG
jgi:hypothetical protein